MDWQALTLSLELAAVTLAVLLPAGLWMARWLAYIALPGKAWIEALVVLSPVLPPMVLGYYLLVSLGGASPLGRFVAEAFGIRLAFSFVELLQASIVFNVSFIVQPVQRAFEAIPRQLGEAAAVSGLSVCQTFCRIELPLAWPGIPSDMVPRFVHTLGEFGVVLMMRVSIPGETKTKTTASRLSISRAPIASPGPAGRGQAMVRPFAGRELEVGGGRMYRFLGYP